MLAEPEEVWRASDGSLRFGRWIQFGDVCYRIEMDGSLLVINGVTVLDGNKIKADYDLQALRTE